MRENGCFWGVERSLIIKKNSFLFLLLFLPSILLPVLQLNLLFVIQRKQIVNFGCEEVLRVPINTVKGVNAMLVIIGANLEHHQLVPEGTREMVITTECVDMEKTELPAYKLFSILFVEILGFFSKG